MLKWLTSQTSKDIVDVLNKIAQIIALLVAGYWGYHIYQQTSKPGLEARADCDIDVVWSAGPSSDYCLGSFTVTIKNSGITAFNITRYKLRALVFSNAELMKSAKDPGQPVFVNYDAVAQGKPFYEEPDVTEGGLTGHYPPGEDHYASWDFLFKKDNDKSVYFSVIPDLDGAPMGRSAKAAAVCPGNREETMKTGTNPKEK